MGYEELWQNLKAQIQKKFDVVENITNEVERREVVAKRNTFQAILDTMDFLEEERCRSNNGVNADKTRAQ